VRPWQFRMRETINPLYPNSNRRGRIACAGENIAMPQCNETRHFRN
jgi:hypothetical protein